MEDVPTFDSPDELVWLEAFDADGALFGAFLHDHRPHFRLDLFDWLLGDHLARHLSYNEKEL